MTLLPPALFQERNGRLSFEKTASFIGVFLPLAWLGWRVAVWDFGARPVSEAIHFTGLWAIRFLLLSLAVTPVRRLFHWPKLVLARRTIGLAALGYACLHLVLYAADQGWDLGRVASEIVLRFYLTIGALALLMLMVLGATSFNAAIRAMGGKRWNALHATVYPIAIVAMAHFFIQSRLDVTEPVMMTGLLALLLGYRLAFWRLRVLGPLGFALLSLAAGGFTALVEVAWYGLATGINPWLVAAANLDPAGGLSPAWWVTGTGLVVAAAAQARHWIAPPKPNKAGGKLAEKAGGKSADKSEGAARISPARG